MIVFLRNMLYNVGILKIKELNSKIISVGNIAAGGTGKTPFVELIVEYLLKKGKFVVIILKGYKREHDDIKVVEVGFKNEKGELSTESLGDEAFLFLENLAEQKDGRGLIVVGDDKTKAAKFASTKFKPEIIIIDDGFQHRKLMRDLDIVILNPDSDKHLLPAGNLREPLKNISRANLVVVNNKFNKTNITENTRNLPRIICSYNFEGFININNKIAPGENIKAFAFCGIGEPKSFKELLKQQSVNIIDFMKFPDHHNFSNNEINRILEAFSKSGAEYIFTTQKDFVRIKNSELVLKSQSENSYKNLLYNYPLYYAKIKMQINRNEDLLYDELDNLLHAI
jgi:tetraacyldisaccharide 4'-kinase